jgi:hypothetical protein
MMPAILQVHVVPLNGTGAIMFLWIALRKLYGSPAPENILIIFPPENISDQQMKRIGARSRIAITHGGYQLLYLIHLPAPCTKVSFVHQDTDAVNLAAIHVVNKIPGEEQHCFRLSGTMAR